MAKKVIKNEIKPTKEQQFSFFDAMSSIVSKEYHKLTRTEKTKVFFMFNRYMAIKFPTQANFVNHRNINTEKVMDFWNMFVSKQFNSTPSWFYTKANRTKKEDYGWYPKNLETLDNYLKHKEMAKKTFNQNVKDFPDIMKKDFESFEAMIA